MKVNFKIVLIVALAVVVGAVTSYLALKNWGEDAARDVKVTRVMKSGAVKKITEIALVNNQGKRSVRIVESEQVRPGASAINAAEEDIDEEDLNEQQKQILKELQDALDDNDLRRVRKVLSKFVAKTSAGGLGGNVPVCMRARAVAALGWFGKDAAIDLLSYMADSNEEIAREASDQFVQGLSDCDMGDAERSAFVVKTLKAISDAEQVESLLQQLNDMRNSVKAEAARQILQSGTDAAKKTLLEDLGSYFDDQVMSADGINRWEHENPDDEGDNEFYGPKK